MTTSLIDCQWLRANPNGKGLDGVDRGSNTIRGVRVAERGEFKSERGQFDDDSLADIVRLGNRPSRGLKSRLAHPTLSDDGIGKFLGRLTNFRLAESGDVVLADMQLDDTSFNTPNGDLGGYVLDLAESDSDAFGMSLVLNIEQRDPETGEALSDEVGEEPDKPPIWHPIALHACDVVDTGDATSSFLNLPDMAVRRGSELLDSVFAGRSRGYVHERCVGWLSKYLDGRFGVEPITSTTKEAEMAEEQKTGTPDKGAQDVELTKTPESVKTPEPAVQLAQVDEAKVRAEATERCQAIVDLCSLAGMPEKASAFFADSAFSVGDVQKHLAEEKRKALDLGEANVPSKPDPEPDPDAEYRTDFEKDKRWYEQNKLSVDDYIQTRRANDNGGVLA